MTTTAALATFNHNTACRACGIDVTIGAHGANVCYKAERAEEDAVFTLVSGAMPYATRS